MYSLIIVIMAIILTAVFLLAGINVINISYFNIKEKESKISTDISNLSSGFESYKSLNGIYLPVSNWQSDIKQVLRYMPQSYQDNSQWSYNQSSSGAYYFCLSNNQMSENLFKAATKIANEKDFAYLNTTCGANASSTPMTTPTSYPTQAALTYWVTP